MAHLRYPAQPRLAAGGVLPRHEAEPSREVAPAPEALHRRCEGLQCHRGDRSDSRDRHQARRLFVLPRARPELPRESFDLLIELVDPPEQQPSQLDDRLRQAGVPVFQHPGQLPDPGPALRSNNSELGEVTPKGIDRLCALAHQQVTRAKEHPLSLLRFRLDRHEVHGRTLRGFRDRLRVRRVVLVPLDEGLHVDRRNQPHLVTERLDLPAPVVGAGARLHRHRARRLRGEKTQQLPAAQLLAVRYRPVRLRPVYLKAALCQIDPDDANLLHWMPPPSDGRKMLSTILAHCDAAGRGRPPHR